MLSPQTTAKVSDHKSWKIKLLYDGACPLCLREVNFLKSKDGDRGLIEFVDIATDDYDPADHAGIDFETAMGRIHAILADGTIVKNVEVFRQTYDILGIGWIYAISKLLPPNVSKGCKVVRIDARSLINKRHDNYLASDRIYFPCSRLCPQQTFSCGL
jgi:predicted DCC family thiol-disulfide oxidoreductase YuxK